MLFKAYKQILEILQKALHSHTDDSLLFVTKRLYVFPFLLGLHFSVTSRRESFFSFHSVLFLSAFLREGCTFALCHSKYGLNKASLIMATQKENSVSEQLTPKMNRIE